MLDAVRSRRELLLAGAAGAVASTFSRSAEAAEKKKKAFEAPKPPPGSVAGDKSPLPVVLKTSIAAYSFRSELDSPGKPGKMSLLDLVDMAARWRIDAVEPTSYYFLKTDDEYLMQLKRKVFLAGLEISGTPINNNFCQKPGKELDDSLAHVKEWVDNAMKLGSPAMRVFAGKPSGLDRDGSFKVLVETMKKAAEYAGQKGVFLTLENHGYMTETADDVLRVIEAVNSDWLRVNLDTGNFKTDPYGGITKLAPHAVTCQVKAFVHDDGKALAPDFERIMKILREAKYRGYVALEYEGTDPHTEVPIYLKKIQEAIKATA